MSKYIKTIQEKTKYKNDIKQSLQLAEKKISLIEEKIKKNNDNSNNKSLFKELIEIVDKSTSLFKKMDLQKFKELSVIEEEIRLHDIRFQAIQKYEFTTPIPKTFSQKMQNEEQKQLDDLYNLNISINKITKKKKMLSAQFFKKYLISNLAYLNNNKIVYSLKYFIKFIENKVLNRKENNSVSEESYNILYNYLQNLETMKASKKDILNPVSLNTFLENYEFNMHNNKNFTERDVETYKINLLRILKKLLTDFRGELGLLKFTQINNRGKIETYGFFSNNNNNNNNII